MNEAIENLQYKPISQNTQFLIWTDPDLIHLKNNQNMVILIKTFIRFKHPGPQRGRERRDSFTGPGPEKGARKSQKQQKNRTFKRKFLILGPKFACFQGPGTLGLEALLFSLYKSKPTSWEGARKQWFHGAQPGSRRPCKHRDDQS